MVWRRPCCHNRGNERATTQAQPAWTSSNPAWEFQAFRRGQEKPALLADSTSPYEFLGQEDRAGSQACSPALSWESRSQGHPPFRKGALSPGALSLPEQEDASCQRVKGHKGTELAGEVLGLEVQDPDLPQSGAVQTPLQLLQPETRAAEPTGGQASARKPQGSLGSAGPNPPPETGKLLEAKGLPAPAGMAG